MKKKPNNKFISVSIEYSEWVLGAKLIAKSAGTPDKVSHSKIYRAGIDSMRGSGKA